mmetsp:Transcript_23635/g.20552  ORF Transcript_23635/g.20552 Transcript_23635/m.20552 type:complete len:357 (-) Transcript_23635:28-1098(-)
MTFNIFGIPMVGPDICGFMGNTTEELCSRWYQASTLYPFSRNHNANDAIPQEPYAMGPTLLTTARITLQLRYALLKHMYALFLRNEGLGTVFRPLFFEFPSDNTFFDHSKNFTDSEYMIGKSLVVAPVLFEGATSVQVYLPVDTWFDFFTGDVMQSSSNTSPSPFSYDAPLNTTVPMFIRGGYIVGTQDSSNISRSDDLTGHYDLVVALKQSKIYVYYANGPLTGIANMEDDNVVDKCIDNKCVYSVNAAFTILSNNYQLVLVFALNNTNIANEDIYVDSITVYGDWSSDLSSEMQEEIPSIEWQMVVDEDVESYDVDVSIESNSKIVITPDSPQEIFPGKTLTFNGPMPSSDKSA